MIASYMFHGRPWFPFAGVFDIGGEGITKTSCPPEISCFTIHKRGKPIQLESTRIPSCKIRRNLSWRLQPSCINDISTRLPVKTHTYDESPFEKTMDICVSQKMLTPQSTGESWCFFIFPMTITIFGWYTLVSATATCTTLTSPRPNLVGFDMGEQLDH